MPDKAIQIGNAADHPRHVAFIGEHVELDLRVYGRIVRSEDHTAGRVGLHEGNRDLADPANAEVIERQHLHVSLSPKPGGVAQEHREHGQVGVGWFA